MRRWRGNTIVADVRTWDRPLFYMALPGTTGDNPNWVRRKANVVQSFMKSTYRVVLEKSWDERLFPAAPRARQYGLRAGWRRLSDPCQGRRDRSAAMTVSGLHERDDHRVVVEALCDHLGIDRESLRAAAARSSFDCLTVARGTARLRDGAQDETQLPSARCVHDETAERAIRWRWCMQGRRPARRPDAARSPASSICQRDGVHHRPKVERQARRCASSRPTVELPFAGHPTVGAAVALGLELRTHGGAARGEGRVHHLRHREARQADAAMRASPCRICRRKPGTAPDRHRRSRWRSGIEPEEIGCGLHQPAVYSAGVTFYLVPVRNAACCGSVTLERRGWARGVPARAQLGLRLHRDAGGKRQRLRRAHVLAGHGAGRGPGDGRGGGGADRRVGAGMRGDGQSEYRLRQGVEMGRPSQINVQIRKDWRHTRRMAALAATP